jgi:MSHA biogenesis protein MshL
MIGSARKLLMKNMNTLFGLVIALMLSACSMSQTKPGAVYDSITGELKQAGAARSGTGRPDAVDKALLPPLQADLPKAAAAEPRFDLVVNNAPANQVFMALVSGTRYSMLVHPEVSGTITVNLKDVTVREALDTIRELYGYEYKVQGTRIFIQSLALQSRVFQINYLAGRRQGQTDTRVTSGSITSSQAGAAGTTAGAATVPGTTGTTSSGLNSSRIFTTSDADFWVDLNKALSTIVGSETGRQVIINTMSGVVVVRALPSELRAVESFLKATQLIVERQVMIEAKIIEVQLKEGYEAGVNWARFNDSGNWRLAGGADARTLNFDGSVVAGSTVGSTLGGGLSSSAGRTDSGIFGLAFRTASFATLLQFLDSQGNTQVLSSPRIATINNQKAVLKVGTDEFFVTNISTSTTTGTTGTTSSPTITVQPFFSGIALDVTPQIDDENNVILHIHPSVSVVAEKEKTLNLGTLGSFTLPLASSSVNETDSIVRVQDGNIVAIGGLMKQAQSDGRSGVPGISEIPVVGAFFGQHAKAFLKRELVILLKPTIIQGDRNWQQDLNELQGRFPQYDPRPPAQTQ